jgi:hypothetical protein
MPNKKTMESHRRRNIGAIRGSYLNSKGFWLLPDFD